MKVGSKHVTYAKIDLSVFLHRSPFVIIETECQSDDKLIYCLECNSVIVSSKENSHTKFHEKIYDLEERLEELEKQK